MPAKPIKPDAYQTPLRSRRDIAAYLASIGGYYNDRDARSYFSFDVKVYGAAIGFNHLIEVYRENGDYEPADTWLDNPEWRSAASAAYGRVESSLFYWALESARQNVVDSDSYSALWDGTAVSAELIWMGRSGGYVGIGRFEGFDFTQGDRSDWIGTFEGNPDAEPMDYATLRKLYAYVRMLEHDLTRALACQEVEYQAAFTFIENVCRDIPRPDAVQLRLPIGVNGCIGLPGRDATGRRISFTGRWNGTGCSACTRWNANGATATVGSLDGPAMWPIGHLG